MTRASPPETWRVWDRAEDYGQTLARRATGDLPEMECAKAVARRVKDLIRPGDHVLDAGCGAGHYLRSLRREIDVSFAYTGVDATARYLELARRAWDGTPDVRFEQGDLYSLPFDDRSFDLVICCNVFLHLPSVQVPLRELVRVSRRHTVIRTLVGERSFRIMEVFTPETHGELFEGGMDRDEFLPSGEPHNFAYYNIYARSWFEKLLDRMPDVAARGFTPDDQYDENNLARDAAREDAPGNTTQLIGRWQVNGGCILLPWHLIQVDKTEAGGSPK